VANKERISVFFNIFFALFLGWFFAFYLFPSKARAATYNPYNVISNAAFENKSSMTASEIEAFLQQKGGIFANYTIPEYIAVPYPYKDSLGDPKWGTVSVRQINAGCDGTRCYTKQMWGKKVSQLIYEECQEHGINPQLMIVMIQKESSAITQKNLYQATQAWALGYGYDETMASYGYSQTTARDRAIAYGGIGQQIARAAMWLRIYYNAALQGSIGATCDGVSMDRANAASQVLYKYTPHSQYNVWLLMQQWFNGGEPYIFGPVSNTSLIKYGTNYYLVYNNKRYNLGNNEKLVKSYGYNTTDATSVSDGEFSALFSGGDLSDYIKSSSGAEYLVAGGLKYYIWPTASFKARWGFNSKTPVSVSSDFLNAIPSAPRPLTGLIIGKGSSRYYFIDGGKRYNLWNSTDFWDRWGFSLQDAVTLPLDFVDSLPHSGKWLTGLIRGKTLPMVYLIDEAKAKPIMSEGIFYHWGWKDSEITWLSDSFILNMPKKSFVTRLMWIGPQIYWINNQALYRLGSSEAIANNGWSWSDIGGVSERFLNGLPLVGTVW